MRRLAAIAMLAAAALPARAERVVALAPLSTAGAEDKSAGTKQLAAALAGGLVAVGEIRVIGADQVSAAIDKARKPQLRVCEDDAACLAELGKLVGAQIVVSGDVGGLGDSRVVYLGATDVATAKLMRSTTLPVGAKPGADAGGAAGAAVRLLDPEKYRGTVHLAIDAAGASVFVNGTKLAPNAKGELVLPVGTHAVRVTHPEYHDFVRFVDVTYGKTTDVQVGLQQYPIIEKSVRGAPTSRDKVIYDDPPLWRRWYVTGPAAGALAIIVGVIAYRGALAHGDSCRVVGGGQCSP
jgi:hypothetical protein